jgi:integrase
MSDRYEEKLEDGKVHLFQRNGIFQARVYNGGRRYIYKSLKTRDVTQARKAAIRLFFELEFRKEQNLPLQTKRLNDVIDEYIKLRQTQHDRGGYKRGKSQRGQHTSAHMLRQIKRVSKFWREYAGKLAVDRIDNAVLADYVLWRRDYYHRVPADEIPRNAKLNPADKTLEWETTFALTLLKFAHERGYRGAKPLPTFRHKASRTVTRPAFNLVEYRKLITGMRRWMHEEKDPKRRYTRELLRDYVLFLANTGMRVGEANNLRESDISTFTDDMERKNYAFDVDGKTGKRIVILRAAAARWVDRTLQRNERWKPVWGAEAASERKHVNRKSAEHDDWLFRMPDGNKVITLIDQFKKVLKREGLTHSADGEPFTLYSLRHFYAVQMLRNGKVGVFDVARNMGTSVQIIEQYYGKHATPKELATRLGG